MADPEVKLPLDPVDLENDSSNPDIEKEEQEKRPHHVDSASSLAFDIQRCDNDEIVWHYLTHETDLPSPAYLSRSSYDDTRSPPPECPDVKKYMSPFMWAARQKQILTWLSVLATCLCAYGAGAYAPAEGQMMQKWHISETAISVGIGTFTWGFGIAPMFLAPFSEIQGRRPVFVITGVLWVIFQMVCAVTPTYAGMIVARFLVGCCSSTFSTMVGGVVSDIYAAKDRNTAMALFAGGAILGTGLGPLVSGFIAQNLEYRWVFWVQVITNGLMIILIAAFFKETRGSVLLSRKAKVLNKWYTQLEEQGYYGMMMPTSKSSQHTAPQRIRWKVKSDEERASIGKMISVSLYRPFHLLVTEPVVFFFSLWASFAWGVLYLLFSAVPLVFQTNHGFDLQQANAVFTATAVAGILSSAISVYQEKWARMFLSEKRLTVLNTPEGRLYFACIWSALLPIGCFWFGWTSFSSISWIVPAIGVGCATMGIFSIYLAVFNYLADCYHIYASSALAAQSFCRNMLAGAFPLFTPQMFRAMTFEGAGSLLGGLAALLTVVPWVLVFFGPKIRARSKIASQIMEKP
ncbi:hypothetical protein LTR78_004818 [Recurvomyces mirabilis]|uniref:Major facilitator superfamily (MFS) profile domain-containing protein n=1 Tax=Recurvomyces mirabilis TaxID=574656 RepID=A0AAE0WP78_9PEZI|nr:hypothetical protein LTR78_004818 [Recurvomyces mirabilis]KAK5157988.1 hypothetical protein LTS14_003911 [Recurvomyces mirabilis]